MTKPLTREEKEQLCDEIFKPNKIMRIVVSCQPKFYEKQWLDRDLSVNLEQVMVWLGVKYIFGGKRIAIIKELKETVYVEEMMEEIGYTRMAECDDLCHINFFCHWILNKPLFEQSDETQVALYSLIVAEPHKK